MKKKILTAALLCLGFAANAQNNIEEFTASPSGVIYKIEKANPEGQRVQEGDIVIGRFAVYYDDSLVFDGMKRPAQPVFPVMQANNMFKGDLIDGLRLMRCGDRTMFAFPKDSMAKYPTGLPKNLQAKYIYYRVQIDSLTTVAKMQEEEMQKHQLIAQQADSLQKVERTNIDKYLTDNQWDKKTIDGIYVKHLVKGKGAKAKKGDVVKIHYTGQLLDGKVFDTSVESVAKENGKYTAQRKYEPLEFQIGAGRMIRGFETAAMQLSKGGKAIVLLPSQFAYGDRDMGEIKPYSPLLFTIELVDIQSK